MHDRLTGPQVLRKLDRVRDQLSPKELERVQAVVALLDAQTKLANVGHIHAQLFPDADVVAANKALSRLLARVNEAAQEASQDLRMAITEARSGGAAQRSVWFEGDPIPEVAHQTPELNRIEDQLVADTRGEPVHEPRLRLRRGEGGKPVVRWFLSYARKDEKDKNDLLKRLLDCLKNSNKYRFEFWEDRLIVTGADWKESVRSALGDAQLGVLLVSPAFFASDFIGAEELPAFVHGNGEGVEGKRAVPVALKRIDLEHTDSKGIGERQIFFDQDGKAFAERSGNKRDAWVQDVVAKVHALLEAYADVDGSVPEPRDRGGSARRPGGKRAHAAPTDVACAELEIRSSATLSRDLEGLGDALVSDAEGRPTVLAQSALAAASKQGRSVEALAYLLE